MERNYSVKIGEFSEKHYIKNFEKTYKNAWLTTLRALLFSLERMDNFLKTDKAETIIHNENFKVIKIYFKIAGSDASAKTSGNRAIVVLNSDTKLIEVVLVYGKKDVDKKNETVWWREKVRENYGEYAHLF